LLTGVEIIRLRRVYVIRKRTAAMVLSGLLTLALVFLAQGPPVSEEVFSYAVANKIIVIDPGHGGIDTGASRGNIVEKDITLAIAKRLAKDLSQGGAAVILLRENGKDLAGDDFQGRIRDRKRKDMNTRVRRANEAKADLMISIHTNAELGSSSSGAQTFYQFGDEKSKMTAVSIQEELKRVLGNTKRKASGANYFVLKNTRMPAVIVEVGFISNPREARLLIDPDYQSKVSYAIFSGITRAAQQELDAKPSEGPGNP